VTLKSITRQRGLKLETINIDYERITIQLSVTNVLVQQTRPIYDTASEYMIKYVE